MKNHELVGLEKTETKNQEHAQWNNSIIRWTILQNTEKGPQTHDIQLQIIYLSGKRIVMVDGSIKHSAMVSFGYNVSFPITEKLDGQIKQDGVSFQFQLYINGESFTSLSNKGYNYQPINLDRVINQETNESPKKKQQPIKQSVKSPMVIENKSIVKVEKEEVKIQKEEKTELQKIKDTQKELMKILKAERKKK